MVQAGGEPVSLTLKEFQLLTLLLEHPGTVFTRDQLLSTIWGYDFDGASRTVDDISAPCAKSWERRGT